MTRARDLADSADKDIAGTITLDAVNASGVITGLTVEATGDTAAGDNAAMGYTAAEGLILTGQGSTGDITIKNDADAVVLQVPTGTTNVNVIGSIDVATNAVIDGTGLVTGVLTTTAATVHNGGITMPDNAIAKFGAGSDLQIYHNGSDSLIVDAGTGDLFIRGSNDIRFQTADGGNTYAHFQESGYVKLYHNNAEKLATASGGVTITGNIANASGNLTIAAASGLILDAAADITLDAAGDNFYFADAGTTMGRIGLENGDMNIAAHRSDYDIVFHAVDNGTSIVPVKIQGDLTITEFIASANTTIAPAIQLSNPNAGNAGDGTAMWFALSRDGGYQFRNAGQIAVIKEQDWTTTASTVDSSMTFATMLNESLVEQARLNSDGDLMVGGTSAGQVGANTARLTLRRDSGSCGVSYQSGTAATDQWETYSNLQARFYIENVSTSNGAYLQHSSSSGWVNVSDQRWKTDWALLDDASSKIAALSVGKYHMLNNAKESIENAKWDYGVKAQELLEVIPDAVDVPENTEDKYGVVPNIVFWYAVKALQEAMTRIETLETQSALFEARLTALEG